jgi:hypothetical protein
MKRFSHLTALSALAFAGALCLLSGTARAQTGAPESAKQLTPKPIWVKAEVVHFDQNSMVVRQVGNEMVVRTFTYAASAQPQVEKALAQGGYQYGDKIRIRYLSGGSVALKIRGKLTKPPKKPAPTPAPTPQPRRTPVAASSGSTSR